MAWTRGLVGILITKLEDKLLPNEGARDRLKMCDEDPSDEEGLAAGGDSDGQREGELLYAWYDACLLGGEISWSFQGTFLASSGVSLVCNAERDRRRASVADNGIGDVVGVSDSCRGPESRIM